MSHRTVHSGTDEETGQCIMVHSDPRGYECSVTDPFTTSIEIRPLTRVQGYSSDPEGMPLDCALAHFSLFQVLKPYPNVKNLLISDIGPDLSRLREFSDCLGRQECKLKNLWFNSSSEGSVSFLCDENVRDLGSSTKYLTKLRIDSPVLSDISSLDLSNVKCLILSRMTNLETLTDVDLPRLSVLVINSEQLKLRVRSENYPVLRYLFIDDCPPYGDREITIDGVHGSIFWRSLTATIHDNRPMIILSDGRGTNSHSCMGNWLASPYDVLDFCIDCDHTLTVQKMSSVLDHREY